MRTLVIGDIHGAYAALLEVLERARVTPDDLLIFLGDYAESAAQRNRQENRVYQLPARGQRNHHAVFHLRIQEKAR